MKKPILIIAIGGFLVIIGIGLSLYGSQLIIENLTTRQESLGIGMSMEVLKELEPAKNENGVYVVQIADFRNGDRVDATIFDPFGDILVSKPIDHNSFQDSFKISTIGSYKLLVENAGDREIQTIGVIGYLPQDASLTVSIFGVIVIIVGLVGLAGGAMYFIKTRGRRNIS
ncbi:MAG: hypothetical protein ACREAG_01085 [Nitrosopumilaceae archaeon]